MWLYTHTTCGGQRNVCLMSSQNQEFQRPFRRKGLFCFVHKMKTQHLNEKIAANPASIARASKNIIEQIGDTPLFELRRISDDVAPIRIYAKAEWFNPGGSVKDRIALNMILEGERSGNLTKEKIILDATSGNTGIGYALVAAYLGYRVLLTMPASVGEIHRQILLAYGAELVFTNPQLGSDGAILKAKQIFQDKPDKYFYPDQYNNPANWQAHYYGTGVEIIRQTDGEITHFVAGLGTSGTFVGTGRRLKEFNDQIGLISFQPDSPMHGLEGLKHMPSSIVPAIYDPMLADANYMVRTEDAYAMIKRLAREEGLFVGPSAGAAMVVALKVARNIDSGLIVVILSDSANKYLMHSFANEWTNGD